MREVGTLKIASKSHQNETQNETLLKLVYRLINQPPANKKVSHFKLQKVSFCVSGYTGTVVHHEKQQA